MRRRVLYWSLFHRDENNQIDDLRTDQVEAVWAAIPAHQRPQWLIWKEGFRHWKPFSEFPLLLENLRKAPQPKFSPPPLPTKRIEEQEKEIEKNLDQDFKLTTTSRNPAMNEENRKQGRYAGKFRLRIRRGDRVYEGLTDNISMNGMLLQSPLPEWLPKYFTLELLHDDTMIPLLCSALAPGEGRPRTRIRIESNDNCEVLRRWLVASTY